MRLFISQNVHGRHKLSDERFEVCECDRCKITFTNVSIDDVYYNKYYLEDYYGGTPPKSFVHRLTGLLETLSFKRKLKLIMKYKPVGNRILEVGCAQGKFLNSLPSYFEKHGVEVNQDAFQYIKKNYQDIAVYNSPIGENGIDGSEHQFDVIVMWQVFEHIDQPDLFLRNLTKLLSKEGVLIFEVPNRNSLGFVFTKQDWFHIDTPRHLYHYNYACLANLLQGAGLVIIKYSGNAIDYFQDLAFSLFKRFSGENPIVNIMMGLVLVPIGLIVRFITSIFATSYAEINIYVIKHSG